MLASPACRDPHGQATVYAQLVLAKRHRLVGETLTARAFVEPALASCRAAKTNHDYSLWATSELVLTHFDLGETAPARDLLLGETAHFEQRLLGLLGVVDARSVENARATMQESVHWLLSVDVRPDPGVAAAQLDAVLRLRGLTERRARLARVLTAAAASDEQLGRARCDARNAANAVQHALEKEADETRLQALRDRQRAAADELARRVRELPGAAAALAPRRLNESGERRKQRRTPRPVPRGVLRPIATSSHYPDPRRRRSGRDPGWEVVKRPFGVPAPSDWPGRMHSR